MTVEVQSCPFCNALVPVGSGGRVTCPRCGETFTGRPSAAFTATPPHAPPEAAPPQLLQAAPPNRPLQLAALSVLVLVLSLLLRAVLTDYLPAQKAFPFMVGL